MSTSLSNKLPTKLDVGCAFRKPAGYWGIDRVKFEGVDQVVDILKFPWDLPTNHFEEIRLWHILQYTTDLEATMAEVWRIARPDARVIIGVPYFMSALAFGDRPRSFFTEHTFDVFTDASWYGQHQNSYLGPVKFRETKKILRTTGRWRKFIPFRSLLRFFLWNIVDELELELRVIKT